MIRQTKRQMKIVGLAVMLFISVNLTLLRIVLKYKDHKGNIRHNGDNKAPIILIWYEPFKLNHEYRADSEACGNQVHCTVTYDKSLVDESDAVVFHFDSLSMETMPEKRKSDQLYVWWSGEKNHQDNLKEYDNFFNLTLTYRRDSGVYAPYGSTKIILEELRRNQHHDIDALLKRKRKSRKLAAWAVSNCSVHRRMKLAQDLMAAGLDLDTFGACFDGRELGDGPNTETFYEALAEYKFYLAFENGYHCKDYITEKFWYNGLRAGAVPVVWGPKKEDLEAVAPKNSFIHADDFENVEDLVSHMLYLSTNEAEYRKYLEWRTWVNNPGKIEKRLESDELHSFCKLCQIVLNRKKQPHEENQVKLTVPSLYQWWWKGENKECIQSDMFDFEIPQDGVREILMRANVDFL